MFAHKNLAEDFANAEQYTTSSTPKPQHLAKLIDSTLLKPNATKAQILELCAEAVKYNFRSVCASPVWIPLIKTTLAKANSTVLACTVIGFPNGVNTSECKYFETTNAVANGADEIDFVQNAGWVKDEAWALLEAEYKGIVAAAQGKLVKVILETSLLTETEIAECTMRAAQCGVHVIKTSTGFGSRGASAKDLEIISQTLTKIEKTLKIKCGIKASGGIRSLADAITMVKSGATRLGTSGGAAIINGLTNNSSY